MWCAKIAKLHAKRLLTCFPLGNVVVVLDQDQSGISKQVRAKGGVLEITVFGTPTGTKTFTGRPKFNNQFARFGATFLSFVITWLRPRRLTRRLIGKHYKYAMCSMSETEDNQCLAKRCHMPPYFALSSVTRWLHYLRCLITPSLGVLLDNYDLAEALAIRESSWVGGAKHLVIAADLAIRQEWRRVNTTQPSLPGGELAAKVMARHSTPLPSVQDMAKSVFPNRRLKTRTHTNRHEQSHSDR